MGVSRFQQRCDSSCSFLLSPCFFLLAPFSFLLSFSSASFINHCGQQRTRRSQQVPEAHAQTTRADPNTCQRERERASESQIGCQAVECRNICQIGCQIEGQNLCHIESLMEFQILCRLKWQIGCQIECQMRYQIICQLECQLHCQTEIRQNVRQNAV